MPSCSYVSVCFALLFYDFWCSVLPSTGLLALLSLPPFAQELTGKTILPIPHPLAGWYVPGLGTLRQSE